MIAAEQKARTTYDNILRLSDDPDVNNVIRFLREREVVHFQRFGEALRLATEKMDQNLSMVDRVVNRMGEAEVCALAEHLNSFFDAISAETEA